MKIFKKRRQRVAIISILLSLMICPLKSQEHYNARYGEVEDYRRSSLCILLVTHQGTKFAEDIKQQFLQMDLPARYNDHNIYIRVLNDDRPYYGHSLSSIKSLLASKEIAKGLVSRWFSRDPMTGSMNMDLIHQRGGYNATYADLKRVENTERGVNLLSEEGTELIQNTFVLVCDLSYYDKEKTGKAVSGILATGAIALSAYADTQAQQGNTKSSIYGQLGSDLSATGSIIASNVGGFAVNMKAYLFKLKWDDKTEQKIYDQYWIDDQTPAGEASQKKDLYEKDKSTFGLAYIGSYRSRSAKTTFSNQEQKNRVIRQVCSNTIDKGIVTLAKMFPVFKPKTEYYCEDGRYKAYIGTKEGVTHKSKYEVLETQKTKHGIKYNRVAVMRPQGSIWNNRNIYMADSTQMRHGGTYFVRIKGKKDLCDQGYIMREMGKAGYQYKRHWFTLSYITTGLNVNSDNIRDFGEIGDEYNFKDMGRYGATWYYVKDYKTEPCRLHGFAASWDVNFHTNFAWTVLDGSAAFGDGNSLFSLNSGIILRTRPLAKKGCMSLFIKPSIGVTFLKAKYTYVYEYNIWHIINGEDRFYEKTYETEKIYKNTAFDWNVAAGINITKFMYINYFIGKYKMNGISVGFHI